MKYLCLVYLDKDNWSAVPDAECADCGQGFRGRGVLLAAEPLHPVDTAATVRVRNGKLSVTDGPFAETKEQLAGFYLLDARARTSGKRRGQAGQGAQSLIRHFESLFRGSIFPASDRRSSNRLGILRPDVAETVDDLLTALCDSVLPLSFRERAGTIVSLALSAGAAVDDISHR
jgi:hypothetical protein